MTRQGAAMSDPGHEGRAADAEPTGTSTLVISRLVQPGREAQYEQLLEAFTAAAREARGYRGANFIRPGQPVTS